MSIGLVVISDNRPQYHCESMRSAFANIDVEFDQTVHVRDEDHKLGFAGAIREAWSQIDTDWVFHLEADFTFNRPVPIHDMIAVLLARPHLVQMALLRQPVNEVEQSAGSVIAVDREAYKVIKGDDCHWLEHKRYVTTNPALWPRWVIDRGWPEAPRSEEHFGEELFASDHTLRAAYWGKGEEWVRHIGDIRTGRGY